MSQNADYALYNTSISFVAQIKAKSEEEAIRFLHVRLQQSAGNAFNDVAEAWQSTAFVSEPDEVHGWDGEKFIQTVQTGDK